MIPYSCKMDPSLDDEFRLIVLRRDRWARVIREQIYQNSFLRERIEVQELHVDSWIFGFNWIHDQLPGGDMTSFGDDYLHYVRL